MRKTILGGLCVAALGGVAATSTASAADLIHYRPLSVRRHWDYVTHRYPVPHDMLGNPVVYRVIYSPIAPITSDKEDGLYIDN